MNELIEQLEREFDNTPQKIVRPPYKPNTGLRQPFKRVNPKRIKNLTRRERRQRQIQNEREQDG